MMQIAALLIGSVRAMPIRAETRIPMKSGCMTVAVFTRFPKAVMNAETPGPTNCAARMPEMMVTPGVTRISTGRLFGDDFSKLGCDDGGNERADRTAEFIARDADGSGGEKDERRCL